MTQEGIDHNAQLISYRILSEVERICDARKIDRKELAKLCGTSASYITQLFRGHKRMNMEMAAKFELFLNITFEIKAAKPRIIHYKKI